MIYCKDSKTLTEDVALQSVHAVITDPPYGLHVLGQKWDKVLPSKEIWKACFDVLKPGGFCLAFGHTKLYHRLACDLEDVGFIIKDCLCWCYATNFPKSFNIAKAIDKKNGFDPVVVGTNAGLPLTEEENPGGYSGIRCDTEKDCAIYEFVSDEAKQWSGWGTALKTGWEPILVAQKPLEGTYVENILKWKVGALNIDECRIPFESKEDEERLRSFIHFANKNCGNPKYFSCNDNEKKQVNIHPNGRWPANLLWLDPLFADYDHIFMVPKPSKSEKGDNEHLTVKPIRLMEHLIKLVTPRPSIIKEDVYVLDPFMGSGSTGIACKLLGRKFIGYENDLKSFSEAEKRLQGKRQFDIFDR